MVRSGKNVEDFIRDYNSHQLSYGEVDGNTGYYQVMASKDGTSMFFYPFEKDIANKKVIPFEKVEFILGSNPILNYVQKSIQKSKGGKRKSRGNRKSKKSRKNKSRKNRRKSNRRR